MSENMNSQTSQAADNGEDFSVQDQQNNGGKGQKLFTQEEVNAFVRSQVGRMMGKATKDHEAEYNKRLADLEARERKLLVKEQLDARGMSRELADIITCTDEDDLNAKLDALQKIYGKETQKEGEPTGFVQIGGYTPAGGVANYRPDPVRKAMGLKG